MSNQSLDDIIDDMRRVSQIQTHTWYERVLNSIFGWIFDINLSRKIIYEVKEKSVFIGLDRRKKPRMIDVIKYHMQPKTEKIRTLESK